MSIFRSTNPADFDDIDGIVVSESAPPSAIQGASTNTVIMCGQFPSGPTTLTEIGSTGELQDLYGKSNTYKGSIALKNKKFGALKLIRVVAADAVKALLTVDGASGACVTFTAKYFGARGNSITVTIAAATTSGRKYTIKDTHADATLPTEIYDDVSTATAAAALPFANSKLVTVVLVQEDEEPTIAVAAALAAGTDGTVADADYQTAIDKAGVEGAGSIIFFDENNATRNGYIKTHCADMQDKVGVMSDGVPATDVAATANAAAIVAVATKRDSDGRLIYAFNPVKTVIAGVEVTTDPASWIASILSLTHPSVDPAFAKNTQYLAGVTGLKYTLTRTHYIALKNAGICAFEYDSDIGFKLKSGITTQILDTSKISILRRRMADFLTQSTGRFLKNYQNATNNVGNRNAVKAAFLTFIAQQERDGVLPKDVEVKTGVAKLVDTDSLNTDDSIGLGFFYVLYKQRIYSSMRYIILQAEIGETVTVTEA